MNSVTLTVPSRLHLGFLDISGSLGRRFGSVGLALDRPVTSLTMRHARSSSVSGPEAERVGSHLSAMCRDLAITSGHRVEVHEAIEAHAGLGSGTQLALAVAAGLRTLHGLRLDSRHDAALLGRGGRSGIGIGLFEQGGLIVDAGRSEEGGPAPVVSRLPVPAEWRVLLILDGEQQGIHGRAELQAFRDLPPFSQQDAAHLCHLVLMRMLPAVAEKDLPLFGAAIAEIQASLGGHFAAAQGGVFTSPAVGEAARFLAGRGGHGPGQSSWGPTGFVFAESEAAAAELARQFKREPRFATLQLLIAGPNNEGARIRPDREPQTVV